MSKTSRKENNNKKPLVFSKIDDAVQNYKLSHHPELLAFIASDLGLSHYLQWIFDNTRHHGEMYHSHTHWFSVALNCYEGGLYEKLTISQLKALFIAGLFHDVGHSFGKHQDYINIKNAIDTFTFVHSACPVKSKLSEEEFKNVVSCIRYTEYPYTKQNSKDKLNQIIRDADLMAPYELPDTMIELYKGLYNEVKTKIGFNEFIVKNHEFLSKVSFKSNWAKRKYFHRNWPHAYKNVQSVLERISP